MTDEMASSLEAGLAVRREVLGDQFVDTAFEAATTSRFGTDWQDFVTAVCWGHLWTRPGIDRKIRSLVNIAILGALDRSDELVGHLRAAKTTGCTEDEIREVLLHVAIYAGVPAGGAAFRAAEQARDDSHTRDMGGRDAEANDSN